MQFFWRYCSFVIFAIFISASTITQAQDEKFLAFIDKFYIQAAKQGISKKTFKRAFANIHSPDSKTIKAAKHQPEFTLQLWQYFDTRIDEYAIYNGRRYKIKYKNILEKIEKKYGISQNILLAIWSMESSYGAALKNSTNSIIRSLATLAYLDNRRSKFARKQLLAALHILQSGIIDVEDLQGSWAGAMGHMQFIPTTYLAYAKDGDGDGKKDVWHSIADALASAANLLKTNGWQSSETWGYEIIVPRRLVKLENKQHTIRHWENLGVRRVNNRQFTNKDKKATLFFPADKSGPAFLLLKNFYVLKSYNNADKYALAVGHLGDRIGGGDAFVHSLARPFQKLNLLQRMELQRHLSRHGFYEGKIDGKIGPQSRDAIIEAQKKLNLKQNGYASKQLLTKLKGK